MATVVYARLRMIGSTVYDSFAEANTGSPPFQRSSVTLVDVDADTKEWTGVGLASQFHPTWIGWRGNRIDAEVTISGSIVFRVRCFASVAGAGRVHVKLVKRTIGGSDIDTLIAEGDDDVDIPLNVSTVMGITLTPAAAVTVGHGERLLWHIQVKRRSADFDTALFTLRYDHLTTGQTDYTLTETVTFLPDTVVMIPRRTADAGIGNFFDLLPTRGVTSSTTGVVDTVASGTEIPWTRTAGGTALKWMSQRFKGPWVMADAAQFSAGFLTAHESNLAANCSVRLKLFRWRPDGTETLMLTSSYASELTTTANRMIMPAATLAAEVGFAEDDRVTAYAYIINIGTMGGARTCTISYDHSSGATGDTSFSLSDMAEFKAEGDPAKGSTPSKLTMVNVGS